MCANASFWYSSAKAEADALAVPAVGTQDATWRQVSPAVMTSRLSESDSASPRHTAEIASATRSPQSGRSSIRPSRVEHAEVVQVDVPVAAVQTRRNLLDTASPRCLEDGQEVRQPDLPAVL